MEKTPKEIPEAHADSRKSNRAEVMDAMNMEGSEPESIPAETLPQEGFGKTRTGAGKPSVICFADAASLFPSGDVVSVSGGAANGYPAKGGQKPPAPFSSSAFACQTAKPGRMAFSRRDGLFVEKS